jgi:DnaJ-class molecular chaperone
MQDKNEIKKSIIFLLCCLLFIILLPLGFYLVAKLPDAVQEAFVLALLCFASFKLVQRTRRNWRRDRGRGVESEYAYAVLGLDYGASTAEIRRAYRALTGKYHPDNVPEDQKAATTALLLRINRAYEMLGDEDARFEYDSFVSPHEPGIISFDEAYTYFLERRQQATHMDEEDYWSTHQSELDQYHDVACDDAKFERESKSDQSLHSDEHQENSSGPVSVHVPETLRDLASEEASTPVTESPALSSNECPACGEPYLKPQGRTGPIHCERCGEQLSS